ncbi:hypothetical protein F5Y05DRAFT_373191 [Hypoxylon sp. FL0543]|nr:hypothetical protein F5Y05DRAFT_373191 [Hypoxylon sp. FL0543]
MLNDRYVDQPVPRCGDIAQILEEIKLVSPAMADKAARSLAKSAQKDPLCRCCPDLTQVGNNGVHTMWDPTVCDSCYPRNTVGSPSGSREPLAYFPANGSQRGPQVRVEPHFRPGALPEAFVELNRPVHDGTQYMALLIDALQEYVANHYELVCQLASSSRSCLFPRAMLYAKIARSSASLRRFLCAWVQVMESQGWDTSSINRIIEWTTRMDEEWAQLARVQHENDVDGVRSAKLEKLQEILNECLAEIALLREKIRRQEDHIWNQQDIMRQLNLERNEAQRQLLEEQEYNREKDESDWDADMDDSPEVLGYTPRGEAEYTLDSDTETIQSETGSAWEVDSAVDMEEGSPSQPLNPPPNVSCPSPDYLSFPG